jgi:hypothetical protein
MAEQGDQAHDLFEPAPAGSTREEPNMKKILGWTIAGIVSLGGIAACSSSAVKSPITTAKAPVSSTVIGGGTATTTAPGAGGTATTAPAAGGSTSAAVDAFCAQGVDLTAKLKKVIADPTNADYASVIASATKYATDSVALMTSNPSDVAKITACTSAVSAALTPGG